MTKKAAAIRNAIVAVFAIAVPVAWADTYYVATNGDDNAAGGETTPFATIAKGVTMATASSAPRKVIVRTGTYKIDSVITISEPLSFPTR